MKHDELTFKRLQSAVDDKVNSFYNTKTNVLKVVERVCDKKQVSVFKEEVKNMFDLLENFNFKIEHIENDDRYYRVDDCNVGFFAITSNFFAYSFDINGQTIDFKLEKKKNEDDAEYYIKNIRVDGKEDGKFSSVREERVLSEITKMIFEIEEVIDSDNNVKEQKFILKESSQDINSIEDEDVAEDIRELFITRYDSVVKEDGEIYVHSDCPRGFSNARKVCGWVSLPKAKIEYKEDFLPFSILSNLEFHAKRLLCTNEFRGFKIEPFFEECDDKYIFLSRVNSEDWFEDIPIEYIPEDIEVGEYLRNLRNYDEDDEELE